MFIQVIQARTSKADEVRQLFDDWDNQITGDPIGWLGGTYGITDDNQVFAVVRFESREKAMENSARPETNAMAEKMNALMDGPPEFYDCNDVTVWLDGGSDDAGFVQIMKGHTDDPSQLKSVMEDNDDIREMRPDIIGGTLAITDDGTFFQTVAFQSEAAAREGEQQDPPPERREAMEQAWGEIEYFDLHQPWFASA